MNNSDNSTIENLDDEIWKDIEGYEGYYQISNLGRVKSLERDIVKRDGTIFQCDEKIKINVHDRNGYQLVKLNKNGSETMKKVHRLVAQAFIPNPDNLQQVNHIDEVKSNNRVDNLEWCDSKYNNNYGTKNQRISAAKTGNPQNTALCRLNAQKNSKKVICLDTGEIFESTQDAANKLGLIRQSVGKVCNGEFNRTNGYSFMFLEDYKNMIKEC